MSELLNLINELTTFYAKFTELQKNKVAFSMIIKEDSLLEMTKKEQPMLLKAKGLDVKRGKLLKQLGFEQMNLGDAVKQMHFENEEEKEIVFEAYAKLEEIVKIFKQVVDKNSVVFRKYASVVNKAFESNGAVINGQSINRIS